MKKYKPSNTSPLLSVIVPAYNASAHIAETIESILKQSYKELEIILVNDKSTDDSIEIMRRYEKSHSNISILNLTENVGPYHGRILGSEKASGEYLAFIDSDDLLTIDYFRTLVSTAENNQSDMVIATTIVNDNRLDQKYFYNLAVDLPFEYLEGNSCIAPLLDQRGNNYVWHVINNKLIHKDLWQKSLPYFKKITQHLVMCDDVAFAFPLWYFAQRIDRSNTANYFYRIADNESATAINSMSIKKAQKNISDLHIAFDFCTNFLQEQNLLETYRAELTTWKQTYAKIWVKNISDSKLEEQDKNRIVQLIHEFAPFNPQDTSLDVRFYDITTPWDERYSNLQESILDPSIECVSFDIFDTLIIRPFYTPIDIFKLLDSDFRKLTNNYTILNFSEMRSQAEHEARQLHSTLADVTIDQIYTSLRKLYGISQNISDAMQQQEIDAEIAFCKVRKSAKELFDLALYSGKKIILTSDMYLPRKTIETILEEAKYHDWSALYLSSEVNKSKAKGTIYPFIAESLSIKPSAILHIGDNDTTDVINAKRAGFKAIHYPTPISCLYSTGLASKMFETITGQVTNYIGQEYFGIATSLAIVSNKFFDNPFTSFNIKSAFNASPTLMGYYGLGMHMFGTAEWLLRSSERENYDNLVFCARDGYLPEKAFEIIARHESIKKPKTHYLPISRKAILPISITTPEDFVHLNKFTNLSNKTIGNILEYFNGVMDEKKLSKAFDRYGVSKRTKCTSIDYFELVELLRLSVDRNELDRLHTAFKKHFGHMFEGNVAVFDIGYSTKPEIILARQFNTRIDTYFTHTSSEGAYRAVSTPNIRLFNFYNFSPFITGGLRELVISELTPSCIRYQPNSDGSLSVVYEDDFTVSYYEKYIIETMQVNALKFVEDVVDIFGNHLQEFTFTNQYISLPLESIISTPSPIDSLVFKPITFEDDMGIGRVADITSIITLQSNLGDLLRGRRKPEKILAYIALDRGTLIGIMKDKLHQKTASIPVVNKTLRSSYSAIRRLKRKLTK